MIGPNLFVCSMADCCLFPYYVASIVSSEKLFQVGIARRFEFKFTLGKPGQIMLPVCRYLRISSYLLIPSASQPLIHTFPKPLGPSVSQRPLHTFRQPLRHSESQPNLHTCPQPLLHAQPLSPSLTHFLSLSAPHSHIFSASQPLSP